jgi:hypothetical protein
MTGSSPATGRSTAVAASACEQMANGAGPARPALDAAIKRIGKLGPDAGAAA